jgi:hypothetical protein
MSRQAKQTVRFQDMARGGTRMIPEFTIGSAKILIQPMEADHWFAALVAEEMGDMNEMVDSIHQLLLTLEVLIESCQKSWWVQRTIDAIDDLLHSLIV